jgi:hypothetical protein
VWLTLLGLLLAVACLCVVGGGGAAWVLLPRLLTTPKPSTQQAAPAIEPPQVIGSLPASPGGGAVKDEHGVSLEVPKDALESGQQAHLQRANLSAGMQAEIEKAYQVESLVYAVQLQDGQDGIGRVELALPAKSADSRLAVLIDDRWLGLLETPAEGGVFRLSPTPSLPADAQTFPTPTTDAGAAPNRYLVLTPKATGSHGPAGGKLARPLAQTDADGKSCISEFWTVNHCWRNPEGSVYVFWEDDVPATLKGQEYLRVVDTIKAVAAIMSNYKQKGFTAAAIGPSNPVYVVIEAGASEPYYSFKTNNLYIPRGHHRRD